MGYLSTRRLSSGSSSFSWRAMNQVRATTPMISGARTVASVQPASPALPKPKSSPPKPNDDRMTESTSRRGLLCSVTLRSMKYANAKDSTAIGSIM